MTVIRGTILDYPARKPGPADVALVVEVAESSLREDRKVLARYAWANIPVAWIVNLNDRAVEVYTGPTGPADPADLRKIARSTARTTRSPWWSTAARSAGSPRGDAALTAAPRHDTHECNAPHAARTTRPR